MDISDVRARVLEIKRLAAEAGQAMAAAQQISPARGTQAVVSHREAPNAIPVGAGAGVDPAAQAQRTEAALLRQARAEASLLAAQGNRAAGAARLTAALAGTNQQSLAAIQTQTQLARLSGPVVSGFDRARGAAQGLTAAFGAIGIGFTVLNTAKAAVQSFADAFKFKADLDASNASIGVLLKGVRDVPATFAAANAYAVRYKLTQEELSQALNASATIMRNSKAPTEQILNVMQRLTVLNPAENIQGAAFALKELQSGDITSIAERFNVSRAAANGMKAEILAGGDAVTILDKYLQGVGVTSEALTIKLDGPVGKMKDLVIQQEQLKLAQANWAMGPGMTILGAQIDLTRGATRLLSGDWTAMSQALQESNRQIATSIGDVKTAMTGWGDAGGGGGTWADQAVASDGMAQRYAELAAEGQAAAAATQAAAQASTKDAIAKLNDATNADILKVKNNELGVAVRAAAAGSDTAVIAAMNLAKVYGQQEYPALLALIGALREKALLEADPTKAKGYGGSAPGDVARAAALSAASSYQIKLQNDLTEATGSTAAKLALVNRQLAAAVPLSDAARALEVKRAQLMQQLAAERTKAGTAADKLATKDASAANAEAVALRDAQRRIEGMTQDHYDKLQRMGEDYTLSQSRKDEDYQEKRQRLLAEGNLKEAATLKASYEKEKRRDAEDRAIALRRENEAAAQNIADAQGQAGIKAGDRERKRLLGGITLASDAGVGAIDAAGARQAQAEASLASTAAQRPTGGLLRIEFAPISLVADGATLASAVYGPIEARLDADWAEKIATIMVTAPPGGGQGGGVGGPRP
jgi:hypothetical protein